MSAGGSTFGFVGVGGFWLKVIAVEATVPIVVTACSNGINAAISFPP